MSTRPPRNWEFTDTESLMLLYDKSARFAIMSTDSSILHRIQLSMPAMTLVRDDKRIVTEFANALKQRGVPEAETVVAAREGDCLHVWTIVNDLGAILRDDIYDAELAILRTYPNEQICFEVQCKPDTSPGRLNSFLQGKIVVNLRATDA